MHIDKSLMAGSTTLMVLSLLEKEERYGYEMIAELARRSDDTFQLKEGTLYPILHGLEKDGRVKSRMKTAENGRERRYYCITPKGLELLKEKKQEWVTFTAKVNAVVLRLAPSGA